jgi:hypothetical protein
MKFIVAMVLLVATLHADTVRVDKIVKLSEKPTRFLVVLARVDDDGDTQDTKVVVLSSMSTTVLTKACAGYAYSLTSTSKTVTKTTKSTDIPIDHKIAVKF